MSKELKKMYEGNIRKNYILYSIPLVISGLINYAYAFIDSMMIGKFLGSSAFAATSTTSPFIQLISSLFWGYLTGVSIYAANLYGRSEYDKMLNIIKTNISFTSVMSILVSASCIIWHNELFEILNISDEIAPEAYAYFGTYMSGFFFVQLTSGVSHVIHAVGLTKTPLIVSVSTGVLKVVGNYVFLSKLNTGVEGCAIMGIIANAVSTTIYTIVLIKAFKGMGLRLGGFKPDWREFKKSVSYAVPTMLQQSAMYLSGAIVSPLTNGCPTAAISGYNIANKANSLMATVYQHSNRANTTYIAQTMGAGKFESLKKGMKIGITQTLLMIVPIIILFAVFAEGFAGLFLDPVKDQESIHYAVILIRYLLPFIIFNVFNNLFHGVFRGVGAGGLLITSTVIYSVAVVVFSFLFCGIMSLENRIYAVYLGLAAAWIVEAVFATICYFSGVWKSKEYKKLEKLANE